MLSQETLLTPVFFTERLSNRVFAACLQLQSNNCVIAINARFRVDPEVMAHALIEEFAHVQQLMDHVDIDKQREQYAYKDRPYEQEAKHLAVRILGYPLEQHSNILVRDEPAENLLDGAQ